MPRNEDGELELILGNRQLLSVFFIIVFLLGVFFAMGYIVGRNSVAAPAELAAAARPKAEPLPAPADTPGVRRAEPDPSAERAKEPAAPVREQEPAKPEAPKSESGGEAPKPPERGGARNPEAGATYLQLTATRRADCESYVEVLRKKGFAAIYSPVPEREDLYRVLVGPLKDAAAVNKTRADLEEAGFPGSKAIRKTF